MKPRNQDSINLEVCVSQPDVEIRSSYINFFALIIVVYLEVETQLSQPGGPARQASEAQKAQ